LLAVRLRLAKPLRERAAHAGFCLNRWVFHAAGVSLLVLPRVRFTQCTRVQVHSSDAASALYNALAGNMDDRFQVKLAARW
jgi:hypothetical protein